MKKSIILAFCLLAFFRSEAQVVLLGESRDSLKQYVITKLYGNLLKDTYSSDGYPVLIFNYKLEDTRSLSAYYFNSKGVCYQMILNYKDDSALKGIVDAVKSQSGYEKIDGQFTYVNKENNIYITFKREESGELTIRTGYIKP